MTNKDSSFPKIPLGCLRDDLPEAGKGDVGLPDIFTARGQWSGTGIPSYSPEQSGMAPICQAGHEPENFLQQLQQKRRTQPCSPAQRCRAGGDHPSVLLQLPLAPWWAWHPAWRIGEALVSPYLDHRDFILPWTILNPSAFTWPIF